MLLEKKNLENELLSERNKFITENDLLAEIKTILANDESKREEIKDKLKSESSTKSNEFDFDFK